MARWVIAAADVITTGGMDLANWHLANYLARRHAVELVSYRVDPEIAGLPNVRVTAVRRPLGMNMLGEPIMRRTALSRVRAVRSCGGIALANGGNCAESDLNWAHYVHAAFRPITAGSPLRRLKTRLYHRYCLRTEREAFRNARRVICNSRLTAGHVQALGVSPERTSVIYFGCDGAALPPITLAERTAVRQSLGWPEGLTAVFVGGLGDRRKGFDVLYAAWRALCSRPGWDVHLAVIGRGAELSAWQRRAREDGLGERVHFLGFRSDVPKLLAACDVMVHPARYEAYGLGVQEAVARGLPAIVSRQAGVAERLAGVLDDLLLDDPDDAAALVEKLRHWRNDHMRWHDRTAPLAETFRARSWDDMSREIESLAASL